MRVGAFSVPAGAAGAWAGVSPVPRSLDLNWCLRVPYGERRPVCVRLDPHVEYSLVRRIDRPGRGKCGHCETLLIWVLQPPATMGK